MRTFLVAPILAAALLLATSTAIAANQGNHGGSRGNAPANSNGVRSLDRDHGLERAADRRNARSQTDRRAKKSRARH